MLNGYRTLALNAALVAVTYVLQASDVFANTKYGPVVVAGLFFVSNVLKRYLAPSIVVAGPQ